VYELTTHTAAARAVKAIEWVDLPCPRPADIRKFHAACVAFCDALHTQMCAPTSLGGKLQIATDKLGKILGTGETK
jgi:hypothetical protein